MPNPMSNNLHIRPSRWSTVGFVLLDGGVMGRVAECLLARLDAFK